MSARADDVDIQHLDASLLPHIDVAHRDIGRVNLCSDIRVRRELSVIIGADVQCGDDVAVGVTEKTRGVSPAQCRLRCTPGRKAP